MTNQVLKFAKSDSGSLVIIYAILFLLLSLFVPYFFSYRNMLAVALAVSQIGIVSCTMMFCLAATRL